MLSHAELFEAELKWFEKVIRTRIEFPREDLRNFDIKKILLDRNKYGSADAGEYNLTMPNLDNASCRYAEIASEMMFEERLLFILALHHHIHPGLIETLLAKPVLKAIIEKEPTFYHSTGLALRDDFGILPTARFYIYLLSGRNLALASEIIIKIHNKELSPIRLGLVGIVNDGITERLYSGRLIMQETDIYELITDKDYNEVTKPFGKV